MESDFHIHSLFSDWLNTVDEIVKYAWEIWLKKIAITDHSDHAMRDVTEEKTFFPSWARYSLNRWKNIWNDVEVIFWVEADLINERWDVCFTSQGLEIEDFVVLSVHTGDYIWNPHKITDWFINAIERYHNKIHCIWHLHLLYNFWEYIDVKKIVVTANKYNIPIELNASTFSSDENAQENMNLILENANEIYINSDSHNLADLRDLKKPLMKFLKENWYLE